MIVEQLTIPAALAAGFAGGAHCAAMCGGIASAAGATFRTGTGLPVGAALTFNGARLVGYALLGALLATVYGSLGQLLPLEGVAWAGRIVAGVVMAALAVRLLTARDWLGVERLGAWVWRGLRPLFGRATQLPPAVRHGATDRRRRECRENGGAKETTEPAAVDHGATSTGILTRWISAEPFPRTHRYRS